MPASQRFASFHPDLRALFLASLVLRMGLMAFPFLSAYLLSVGYRVSEIALVVGAFGVGALLADVSASVFLSKVSTRAMIVIGLCLHAVVLCAIPLLGGVGPLIVAALAWGYTYEIYTPAVSSLIVELTTPEQSRIAFALNRLAINIGMGVGPVLGGLAFGWQPKLLFYANAAAALLAAGYLLAHGFGRSGARRPSSPRAPRPVAERAGREATQFATIFTLALPLHVAYALPSVFLGAYLVSVLGLPSYWASILFGLNAVLIIAFEVPLNLLMRSVSLWRSLLIGYLLAGTGFLAMSLSSSPAVLLAATVGWTAGEMILFPALLSYVSELSSPTVLHRNLSLYSGGANLGILLAPPISLAAISIGSPSTPWLLIGLVVLVAGALLAGARYSPSTWYSAPSRSAALRE